MRQKTRWLTGIALSGWDRLGWPGGWADRYMLVHHRKAILTALLSLAGYVSATLVLIDLALAHAVPAARSFGPPAPAGSILAALLWINALALGWRLGLRGGLPAGAHGWREGVRAVPRVIVGNLINAAAAVRALRRYHRIVTGRAQPVWDKTAHKFPGVLPVCTVRGGRCEP